MRWGQWEALFFIKESKSLSCYSYHSSFPVCFAITLITTPASLALAFPICIGFQPLLIRLNDLCIWIKWFMYSNDFLPIHYYLPLPSLKSISAAASCFLFLFSYAETSSLMSFQEKQVFLDSLLFFCNSNKKKKV